MSFWEEINAKLKKAMIEKDTFSTGSLRMFVSEIRNSAINNESEDRNSPSDSLIQEVALKQHKKVEESLSYMKDKSGTDDYRQLLKEKEILSAYLPKQLSQEELLKVVYKVKKENPSLSGMQLMGKVIQKLPKGTFNPDEVKKLLL